MNMFMRMSRVVWPLLGTMGLLGMNTVQASSSGTSTLTTTLANEIVAATAKISSSAQLTADVKPFRTAIQSVSFDWNEALFSTDAVSASQTSVATVLVPAMQQLVSFSVTTNSAAVSLINGVITGFQHINASIASDDVVQFLQSMEQATGIQALVVSGQTTLTNAEAEAAVHAAVASALASASPLIQQSFSGGSGSSGVGTGGSIGGSGTTGTGTSSGGGSISSSTGQTGGSTSAAGAGDAGGPSTTSGSGQTGTGGGTGTSTSTTSPLSAPGSTGGSSTGNKGKATVTYWDKKAPDGLYIDGNIATSTTMVHNHGWTYVSLAATIQSLHRLHVQSQWNGDSWRIQIPFKVNIPSLTEVKPGYARVYVNGRLVDLVSHHSFIPSSSAPRTTYLPVGQLIHLLRDVGIKVAYNGHRMDITLKP